MGKINSNWKKSIFFRLVVTMLVGILPIYITGIILYNAAINTVKDEIVSSTKSQVDYLLNNLEMDFNRILLLENGIVYDADLNQLASALELMNENEKAQAILRLQNRLLALQSSSTFIDNVNAHIPSLKYTITTRPTGIIDIEKDRIDEYKPFIGHIHPKIYYYKDKMFFFTGDPAAALYSSSEPLYVVDVELSKKSIKNSLIQLSTQKDSGSMILSLNNDFLISSIQDDAVGIQIKNILKNEILGKKFGSRSLKIDGRNYLVLYTTSEDLQLVLCKYVPLDQVFDRLYKYRLGFWVFSVVAFIIIILFSTSFYKFIHKPLSKLVKSFRKVEEGNLNIVINHNKNDEFEYIYQRFNAMVDNVRILISQVYEQKILAQKSELKSLQSQINPHFLYNSFFNLHNMVIKGDYENVEKFTKKLGTFFQFITRSAADEIPLSKEIEHARTYAEIQESRFRNRIKVKFDELPGEIENIIVPRIIIQPVIENVFEHGLTNKIRDGMINVSFTISDGKVLVTIEDNGDELDEQLLDKMSQSLNESDGSHESTGIVNINRRLKLKYGLESGIMLSRSALGGLRVDVVILLVGEV